jgi:hypothetical protein
MSDKTRFESHRAIGIHKKSVGNVISNPFGFGIADRGIPCKCAYIMTIVTTAASPPNTRIGRITKRYTAGLLCIIYISRAK